MDHDISKNKSQMKYSGKLMRHWYWCIFLTLMLLVLTAVVLYINTLAGVIVGGFTVMVYLTILGLDVYYRPKCSQSCWIFHGNTVRLSGTC